MVGQKLYDWGGSEFGVATATSGDQVAPGMAWVSATSYVVIWTVTGANPQIRAQLFDVSGARIGGEFTIGADHGGAANAVVTQLAGGGFVVAWEDVFSGSNADPSLIRFQRFDSSGNAVGAEGVLQTMPAVHEPAIAGLAGGGFVITWTDKGTSGADTLHTQIYGQVFDSAGAPTNPFFFTVNTIAEQSQEHSSIAALPGGGFAVTWQDGSPQGERTGSSGFMQDGGTDIAIQIFDASGAKVGPQRVVDEMTPALSFSSGIEGRVTATQPAVTALADGRLAVVWADFDGFIKTRILAADGSPLTPVVKSDYWTAPLAQPAITALSDGGYAVSWTEETRGPPDSSGTSVRVAVYDSTGSAQGEQFVANQTVDGPQGAAAMLGMPGGGFAMTWQDSSSVSAAIDIRGQYFVPDAGAITDIAFSAASISQTAVENIAVGRLSAEGALNGTFSYQILSDSSGALRIEGDQIVVDDSFRLASLAGASVSVAIRVTDSEGNSHDEAFVIPITRPASGTLYVAEDQFVAVPNPDDLSPVQVPDLLTLAGGRVLLTWNGVADSQDFNIVGQLFESDGSPVAPPFTLNTLVNGLELQHDLAALPGGGFVATWVSSNGDGANNLGVRAQLFDVNGNKLGSEFSVNTTTQSNQQQPSVTALAGGGFFIAWQDSSGTDPLNTRGEIRGQFFTSAGVKSGGELLINTTTTLPQTLPAVTELASGKILIAWTDTSATGGDTSASAIRATLLNADGSVATPEFLVNMTTLQHQHLPSVTALAGGGFVIIWRDTSENPVAETNQFRPADIRGQLYDANGQPIGSEFLVNQDVYDAQAEPLVVAAADGGFVVTWSTTSKFAGDGDSVTVMARNYAADGSPAGNEFIVNQIAQGQQSTPAVTFLASGDIVFAWWDLQTRLENGNVVREISGRVLRVLGEVVNGSAQGETIIGSAGNDVLDGGGGADTMTGGLGNDIYVVDNGGDVVSELGGQGTDEIRTALATYALAANVENLTGTSNSGQSLTGNGEANLIAGMNGDDVINGGGSADTMSGGLGNDIYYLDNFGDVVVEHGGEGTDEIRTSLNGFNLLTTPNVENLVATSDDAHGFRGNGANNLIAGGGGNDSLFLQDGGNDSVNGGGGDDIIYFGGALNSTDAVNGGAGARDVLVLQGNYALTMAVGTMTGVEFLSLQSGSVTRYGDTANNFYDYDLTLTDANVAAGVQLVVNGQSLRVGEDLSFDGSAELDGRFLVYGGHGVDSLKGGAGNDIFFFEGQRWGASDVVNGGGGRDALVFAAGNGLTHIEFGETSLTSIESISVNNRFATDPSAVPSYELVLRDGNVAANALMTINGSSLGSNQSVGVDAHLELDGAFNMFGGAGADTFIGGAKGDLIYAAGGADTLTGGGGGDTFQYRSTADSATNASDHILDFTSGTDRIDLGFIDADTSAAGDQAFHWIGGNAFTGAGAASAGELRAYESNGSWFVEGDVNGDGVADMAIHVTLAGPGPIGQGDFLL